MTEEEHYREAYRLYSREFRAVNNMSTMTMWGFRNILPYPTKKDYLDKAIISLRRRKINEIKKVMKINKNYLAFRKWYSSNKIDDNVEKIAMAAWVAAIEFISQNYEIKKKEDDQDKYFLG